MAAEKAAKRNKRHSSRVGRGYTIYPPHKRKPGREARKRAPRLDTSLKVSGKAIVKVAAKSELYNINN